MEDVLAHWPFVMATLILAIVGQVAKTTIFSTDLLKRTHGSRMGELLWVGRKTLPLHPVVAGMALGFVPGMPVSPGVLTLAAKVLYFAGAGMASTWAFAILKGVAKEKGYDLNIPTESVAPSAPPGQGPGGA